MSETTPSKPTWEQVLAEPAGRQMDAWIAEHVFGWERICVCGPAENGYNPDTGRCTRCGGKVSPTYSTDIAGAWLVVELLRARFGGITITDFCGQGALWSVGFVCGCNESIVAETAPLAICRAGLISVLEENATNV